MFMNEKKFMMRCIFIDVLNVDLMMDFFFSVQRSTLMHGNGEAFVMELDQIYFVMARACHG